MTLSLLSLIRELTSTKFDTFAQLLIAINIFLRNRLQTHGSELSII